MKAQAKIRKILTLSLTTLSLVSCGGTSSSSKTGKTHDNHTHVVNDKGVTCPHNFVDGKCTMCDEETVFRQDPMYKSPEILSTAQAHQGTLEYFWYKTRAYGVEDRLEKENREHKGEELWIYKRAYVYLPYGYDKNDTTKKYNVMYMMHGNGLNEGYWFRSGDYARDALLSVYTNGYGTNNVIDYLTANKKMEDTIFVAMTMYQFYDGEYSGDPENPNYSGGNGEMANIYSGYVAPENDLGFRTGIGDANQGNDAVYYKEWQYHLMPYVVEHYNTYAASTSDADLKAARDHVAFTGLSRGGSSVNSIMANSLEYCSYFAYESGGQPGQEQINNIKAKEKDYPVRYVFVSCGSQEGPVDADKAVLKVRDELGWKDGSDIQGGDKIAFIQVNGTAHNYATWITNLYNFLLVSFK